MARITPATKQTIITTPHHHVPTSSRSNKKATIEKEERKRDSKQKMIAKPIRVVPHPSMSSQVQHDPLSGQVVKSPRKHPPSNNATFLDRQNAQRKRQRRQTAGALVTGLFGSNNNNNNNTTDAAAAAEGASPVAGKKGNRKKSTAQPRPEIQVPPRGIGPIYEPNVNDVLCGRGGRINAHEGNVRFRQMVVDHKKEYLAPTTKKLAKAHIAAQLVRDIRTKEPSGRFLKEDPDGAWFDIGDAKAIKKVGQALREGESLRRAS